jgi:hypothetical protein
MTKKDFINLADLMAKMRMRMPTDEWVYMMHLLIEICEHDNSAFDTKRFKEACYK